MYKLRVQGIGSLACKGGHCVVVSKWTRSDEFLHLVASVYGAQNTNMLKLYLVEGGADMQPDGPTNEYTPDGGCALSAVQLPAIDATTIVNAVREHLESAGAGFIFEDACVGVDRGAEELGEAKRKADASTTSNMSSKTARRRTERITPVEDHQTKPKSNARMFWHVTTEDFIGRWHAR